MLKGQYISTNSAVQLLSMVVQREDLIDFIRGRKDSCMMLVSVFLHSLTRTPFYRAAIKMILYYY